MKLDRGHTSGARSGSFRGFTFKDKYPKGPCTQIVYTLALKYLYRDYIKANVYTIWVHGPLGVVFKVVGGHARACLLKVWDLGQLLCSGFLGLAGQFCGQKHGNGFTD